MKEAAIKKRMAQKEMVKAMSAAAEACARAIDNVEVPVQDAQAIGSLVAICLELVDRMDPREFLDVVETVEQRAKFFKKHQDLIIKDMNEESDTADIAEG